MSGRQLLQMDKWLHATLQLLLLTMVAVRACSYFSLFPYDYLEVKETYIYPYWNLPNVPLGQAKDEAVMLIGGLSLSHS